MSLFKLKSLWNQNFPQQQFDEKHLSIGKISDKPCITLGSYKGIIRTYIGKPQNNSLKIKQIYENNFGSPIIDVKFVLHPDQNVRNAIGVLLFRKFAFLAFDRVSADQYNVKIRYVDVQPGFGIGISPLSIMTLNSSIQYLNPLSTQTIKVSNPIYPFTRSIDQIYYIDGQQLVLIEGNTQQWRIIVGRVRNLYVLNDQIIAIGDRAVWQIHLAQITKTKVLQDQISYGNIIKKDNSTYNLILANFNCQILIYTNNYQLLWAIKLDSVVLKVLICYHPMIQGALAILTQNGTVELCYSGSELPQQTVQPLSQQINIKQVQEQTQRLQHQLQKRKAQIKGQQVYQGISDKKDQVIQIKIDSNVTETSQYYEDQDQVYKRNGKIVKWLLRIQIKPQKDTLINLQASLKLPSNLICPHKQVDLTTLKNKETVSFTVYVSNSKFPFQEFSQLTIRYQSSKQSNTSIDIQKKVHKYTARSQKYPYPYNAQSSIGKHLQNPPTKQQSKAPSNYRQQKSLNKVQQNLYQSNSYSHLITTQEHNFPIVKLNKLLFNIQQILQQSQTIE